MTKGSSGSSGGTSDKKQTGDETYVRSSKSNDYLNSKEKIFELIQNHRAEFKLKQINNIAKFKSQFGRWWVDKYPKLYTKSSTTNKGGFRRKINQLDFSKVTANQVDFLNKYKDFFA